jgi:hypothetical protein
VFLCHRKILLFSSKKMKCVKQQNECGMKYTLPKNLPVTSFPSEFSRPDLSFRAVA